MFRNLFSSDNVSASAPAADAVGKGDVKSEGEEPRAPFWAQPIVCWGGRGSIGAGGVAWVGGNCRTRAVYDHGKTSLQGTWSACTPQIPKPGQNAKVLHVCADGFTGCPRHVFLEIPLEIRYSVCKWLPEISAEIKYSHALPSAGNLLL